MCAGLVCRCLFWWPKGYINFVRPRGDDAFFITLLIFLNVFKTTSDRGMSVSLPLCSESISKFFKSKVDCFMSVASVSKVSQILRNLPDVSLFLFRKIFSRSIKSCHIDFMFVCFLSHASGKNSKFSRERVYIYLSLRGGVFIIFQMCSVQPHVCLSV